MNEIATVSAFDALGTNLRFGVTDDGTPFVVLADIARLLGHRDAANAGRMLDEIEKGTQIVSTPGGDQRVSVAYEDGIWELVFRSQVSGAKAIKKRVKEILREIRQTGSYSAPPAPVALPTTRELALLVIAAEDRADAQAARAEIAEQRNAELEPKAAAADALAEADGVLSIGAVANMFEIGRQKFFDLLRDEKILMRDRRPYQEYAAWFRVATKTYESSDGHRHAYYLSQLYPSGAVRLHALLTKRGHSLRKPVIDNQLRLLDGGAA